MVDLTPDDFAALKTHDLKDDRVRMALAGFLYQEFRSRGVVILTRGQIATVIGGYIVGVDNLLEKAEALRRMGFSPRNFETQPRPEEERRKWLSPEHLDLLNHDRCPDCEIGPMMEGPKGGGAMNIACACCGSEFNVASFSVQPGVWVTGHRNSVPGQPNRERLRDVFGIEELPVPYTCVHCGWISYHPKDAEHGYCGHCHGWAKDPVTPSPEKRN